MGNKQETNLHSLWDSGLIHKRISNDFQSNINKYYEYLHGLMNNQSGQFDADEFKTWIDESIKIVCEDVYLDENNGTMNASAVFHLGDAYYERNIPTVERRIILAGRRLGYLLNTLASKRPKKASPSEKLCPGTIGLIAVLSIEFVVIVAFIVIRVVIRRREPQTVSHASPFSK